MRHAITGIAIALLLCSCTDEIGSLKAELATRRQEMRGNEPPPLPALRPAPEFRYDAARLPDPFYPDRR